MNDVTRAKELFLQYSGDAFQMERQGVHDEYRGFNIAKETEAEWREDWILRALADMTERPIADDRYYKLKRLILSGRDLKCFRMFMNYVQDVMGRTDTFSLLLFAEGIAAISLSFKRSRVPGYRDSAAEKLVHQMIEHAANQSVNVDGYYRTVDYLQDILTEKEIRRRFSDLETQVTQKGGGVTSRHSSFQ